MRYVLGLAFDKNKNLVLVRKTKPRWQNGFLNGPGGAVEETDNTPLDAMVREFFEETSIQTSREDWRYISTIFSDSWKVYVFTLISTDDFSDLHMKPTDTDEHLEVLYFRDAIGSMECVSNLSWLIGMCLDEPINYSITFKEYEND